MATASPGILTAQTTPALARRTWPRWLALGLAMLAAAGTAIAWDGGGARLLLGAVGLFLAVRGVLLVRGARAGALDEELPDLAGSAGTLGRGLLGVGVLALAAALVPSGLAGVVLLVAVPVLLLGAAALLLGRGGTARRGGVALLVWSVLVTGVLAATGAAQGVERAAGVATVVCALAVAVLAVPVLLGALNLRAVARQPEPAPARPAGCAGCACGAGGCG